MNIFFEVMFENKLTSEIVSLRTMPYKVGIMNFILSN